MRKKFSIALGLLGFATVVVLTVWILKPTSTQSLEAPPTSETAKSPQSAPSNSASNTADSATAEPEQLTDVEQIAKPSNLPITLVGTVVRLEPSESFGTIRLSGQATATNQKTGSQIPSLAQITSVRRERLYFTNLQTQKPEYIRISSFDSSKQVSAAQMTQASESEFHVPKSIVEAALSNLPHLLTQARAVPVMDPSGHIAGFRIDSIQPGSLFEKLGLLEGDEIESVNGIKVDSPATALRLLEELRGSSMLTLGLKRQGRDRDVRYLVR